MSILKQRLWRALGALVLLSALSITGTLCASAHPGTIGAFSQAAGATGQGIAANTSSRAGAIVQAQYSDTIPQLTPQQANDLNARMARADRTGPAGPKNASAQGQARGPEAKSPAQAASFSQQSVLPGDFVIYRDKFIPAGGISGGYGNSSYTNEPSTAVDGKNIFQTGNWYASRSLNNGATWQYLNPFTIFSDSTVSGFCCDQVTLYDAGRDRVFWLQQYGNGLKLALSSGQSLFKTWCYYNITPGTVGEPADTEIDYNDLALGSEYVYIASNLFPAAGGSETEILRMPIDSLLTCGAWSGGYIKVSDRFTFKPVQGAADVMYWGSNWGGSNGSDFRIYSWAENSGSYFWYDRSIDSYTFMYRNNGQNCASQNGVVTNWCQFADSRVLGAYRANGVLGFSFNAQQDGTFPFPYTRRVYFNESDKTYIGSANFWGSWGALLFMQLAPNARGHIGGVFAWGGGTSDSTFYPGAGVLIDDDYSPNQPWSYSYYLSGVGNTCQYQDTNGALLWRWGDYLTVRPLNPASDVWVGTGYAIKGANCGSTGWKAQPHNVVFGRGRDNNSYFRWDGK